MRQKQLCSLIVQRQGSEGLKIKPGIHHIAVYGSEGVGKSEMDEVGVIGLEFGSPQQDLLRADIAF